MFLLLGVSIDSVIGVSRDGRIEVQWSLRTTGGHDINTIQVTISCTTTSPNTQGTAASYECSRNCFDSALNSSKQVGPVDAGFKYTCLLTVRTEESFETVVSSNIDSSTGLLISYVCYLLFIHSLFLSYLSRHSISSVCDSKRQCYTLINSFHRDLLWKRF